MSTDHSPLAARDDMRAEQDKLRPGLPSDGSHARRAHSRGDAEVETIVTTLRSYGVLTRARLAALCRAGHWSEPGFRRALALAVSSGRVRPLSGELYEITESPPPEVPR